MAWLVSRSALQRVRATPGAGCHVGPAPYRARMTIGVPPPRNRRDAAVELLIRLRLFLVSYAPLAGIFAWKSATHPAQLGWGLAAAAGVLLGALTTYGQLHRGSVPVTVDDVDDRGGDVAGYLASYLLPFIAGPPDTLPEIGAYLTYFVVAALVYVRSRSLMLMNPTLYLLGWKVVGVEVAGRCLVTLCRNEPVIGQSIDIVTVGGVAVRKDNPRKQATE